MKTMTQAQRASEALQAANIAGCLKGALTPAVFGCPHGHTARIITSPLPFGRCNDCGTQLTVLDAGQLDRTMGRHG
jgi:hypothetical protein